MEGKLIYEKIPAIMAEVEPIAKAKKNLQQGYQFRGIDDMYNALQSLFQKHKVFPTTNVLESRREERVTKNGGTLIYTIQKVEFTFFTTDGSFVKSTVEGEGMDNGDKSTNKAMSAAQKYALIQMFLIPTEEKKDSEYDSHELMPSMPAKPEPGKKEITDKAFQQAIKRITEGEAALYDKIVSSFSLTKEQLTQLNKAAKKQ